MNNSNNAPPSLFILAAKLGGKIFTLIVGLLRGLTLTKIGLAAISFAGYTALLSWKFALLIMISIFVHEHGHLWAMRKLGMKTRGFYFIPFVGGVALSDGKYLSYKDNVFVAIMGPVWGGGLALIMTGIYYLTGNPLWCVTASWVAALNILNLLPTFTLDGGQIMKAIAISIPNKKGLILLAISSLLCSLLLFKMSMGLFSFILIIGTFELFYSSYKQLNSGRLRGNNSILLMDVPDIILSGLYYLGLIFILIAIIGITKSVPGSDLAAAFLK